jgi:hypothetical protein
MDEVRVVRSLCHDFARSTISVAIFARFKLYLRPTHLPLIDGLNLPPLPAGKTVDDVFADFLTFVKDQVQGYITKGFAEGARIWAALSPTMEVVLTTPNGWELEQQQRMRAAAQQAGLISLGGGKRVRFVTEAEAIISTEVVYRLDTHDMIGGNPVCCRHWQDCGLDQGAIMLCCSLDTI